MTTRSLEHLKKRFVEEGLTAAIEQGTIDTSERNPFRWCI
jgi:hypothetical protein